MTRNKLPKLPKKPSYYDAFNIMCFRILLTALLFTGMIWSIKLLLTVVGVL